MSEKWYVSYSSDSRDDGQTTVQCLSIGPEEDDQADAFAFSAEFGREGVPDGVVKKFDLMASAPDLLAELREMADWLTERAKVLRQLADQAPGVMRKRNEHLRQLRDEAARLDGRAAVIRQTILKATQGA